MPTDDRDDDDRPARTRRRDPDDRDEDEDDDRRGYDRRHYDEDGYEITSNDQMWALFTHIGVFVVGFLAPLIIYFLYADKSKFVARHAKESLNNQISMFILTFAALFVAAAVGFGVYGVSGEPVAGAVVGYALFILVALALGIKNMIFIIMATLAASRYEPYRYPLTIRLLG